MATHIRHRALAGCLPPLIAAILCLAGCAGHVARDREEYYRSALLEHHRGQYQSALAKARAGRLATSERDNPDLYWRFRLLEAETLLSTGATAEAVKLLETTSGGATSAGKSEARRLLNLGWAKAVQSAHQDGLALLDEACRLAQDSGDSEALAQAELRRGTTLSFLKRRDEAEGSYQRSLGLARGLRDPYLEGSALGSLGYLRLTSARYEEAIFYFDQVLPLAARIGSSALEAITISNLGWCYFRLGDLDKAAQRFEQAQALLKVMGKESDYQITLGNLGSAWFARGEFRKAIDFYERALGIARQLKLQPAQADWLSNLATAHIELGEIDQAAALNAQALTLRRNSGDRETDSWLMVNEGRILEERGDLPAAEARFQSVADSPASQPTTRFEARARLAHAIARQGRQQDADDQYRKLLSQLNEYQGSLGQQEWKITWQSSLIRFYKDYVDFLWDQGRKAEALDVAETSRARVLAERLGDAKLRLGSRAPDFNAAARRTGCTLLSYWLGSDRSYLWVITAQGTQAHELPSQTEIAADVESYRRAIERLRDPLLADLPAQERLSRTLLGPVQNPRGCFIVSPDQELHGLNFETLLVRNGDKQQYWVEQAELSIVPSLAIQSARSGNGPRNVLLLGDPVSADVLEFPTLAHAGEELEAISKLLAPRPSTLIRGVRATPAAYLNAVPSRFGLIHIAAHATANRESPLDSAIILTREGERYTLTAREISSIPLEARLVTISACRGAGSRAYAGEGTVGLAWGFLHAGAGNVIAGLWAVDDVSTSKLMEQLYTSLAKGSTPAAALRSAKLALLRSLTSMRKPYYWAPFQLYRLP